MAWNALVGLVGRRAVALAQRGDEQLVGAPELPQVAIAQLRDGELGGQPVHDREQRHDVLDVGRGNRRHAGETLRLHLHEPLVAQPRERLAHGRPAEPQPAAELVVVEGLARHERAVDDRLAQLRVGGVPQQRPVHRAACLGNWHFTFQ